MVFEKETSGYQGITSSIHLNSKISVFFFVVLISNLFWSKQNDDDFYFVKTFFYVTSGLADMTSLKFQLRTSFLFYFGLSHNLFRVVWEVHVTLRLYQISCDLEGHLDIGVNGKVNVYSFVYRLICQFITPSIFDRASWKFQLLSLKNGTSGFGGITSSTYLNWNIFVLYCQIEIKLVLVKAEWWWLSFLKKYFSMSLPVSQTWRH